MKVELVLREPGNHHKIADAEMECIPREGESVIIDDQILAVHEVIYILTSTNRLKVRILLK